MAYRVDGLGVKEVIETDLTETEIIPFIRTANVLISEYLSGSGLSSSTLTEIERYLAAHVIALTKDQKAVRIDIDGVVEEYQGKTWTDFKATFYGQVAVGLDSTGRLSKVGKGKSSIKAIDLDLA